MSGNNSTRTSRYRTALWGGGAQPFMTVRQICEAAGIPPDEAKFISCDIVRLVKLGSAEQSSDPVKCPITQRSSTTYRLLVNPAEKKPPAATVPKRAKAAPEPVVEESEAESDEEEPAPAAATPTSKPIKKGQSVAAAVNPLGFGSMKSKKKRKAV